MAIFKNISVGFLVSFIGSIPLGYMNVVGYEIYKNQGANKVVWYLLGVVFVEFFVVYWTLIFADKLAKNTRLIRLIKGFSVVFMFVLAFVFYSNATAKHEDAVVFYTVSSYAFWVGLFLSCTNFIQIPFWTSWNLYLLNGKYIEISKSKKYYYVLGAAIGTFLGMLTLILSLSLLSNQVDFLSKYLLKYIIPIVFIGLGMVQAVKFFKK